MTDSRRRSTSTGGDSSLNYAAVGATESPDVVMYPPPGFRTFQASHRIGSGDDRFESASRALMTWGVQRNSGVQVSEIARDQNATYHGIEFDETGRPLGPAEPAEELFSPDGTPFVSAGTTATMRFSFGPFSVKAPVKVVYVLDEPSRIGFAYGSRHGHPARTEQLQYVEKQEDGTVWLTVRSISAPVRFSRGPAVSVLRAAERHYAKRFLTALHPTRTPGS
ncbi:DUF1990 family protein [Naasia sp. SYSU D00948]|uniref:DUF1990 family protein n=1 Tax=Naasia sp. SYSU D00948 TaxID=2817379 RepID=UPI001B31830A|nr:DUF1990 domain-containing protein [Naasia sp. SYSU D00948]